MIRKAQERDCAGIGAVYCFSWKKAYEGIVPQDFLNALTPESCTPPANRIDGTLVCEENRDILGLVSFGKSRDGERNQEIYSLYVLPDQWKRGIGQKLLLSALEILKHDAYLWTLAENARARRFYEKMGMELTGKERTIAIGGKELTEVQYKTR